MSRQWMILDGIRNCDMVKKARAWLGRELGLPQAFVGRHPTIEWE